MARITLVKIKTRDEEAIKLQEAECLTVSNLKQNEFAEPEGIVFVKSKRGSIAFPLSDVRDIEFTIDPEKKGVSYALHVSTFLLTKGDSNDKK